MLPIPVDGLVVEDDGTLPAMMTAGVNDVFLHFGRDETVATTNLEILFAGGLLSADRRLLYASAGSARVYA